MLGISQGAAMHVHGPSLTAGPEDSQHYASPSSEKLALTLQFKNVACLVFNVSKVNSTSKDIYRFSWQVHFQIFTLTNPLFLFFSLLFLC